MDSSRVRVVAAVIERGGQMLVAKRPVEKRHGGLCEFPGGKAEAGESDAEALTRELAEEFGVQVTGVSLPIAESTDPGSSYLIAFLHVTIHGTPDPREHLVVRWVDRQELSSLPLAPADRQFLNLQRSSGAWSEQPP